MNQLAIDGGKPVRQEPLSYGKQFIDDDDIRAVVRVLRSPYLTTGPEVPALEQELAQLVEADYAVAVSSGTAALHLACMAIGLKPGDEVITTPLTFVASANCVRYCGATVVFADIRSDTYQIDVDEIKKKITAATKAVIVVDFAGQAVDLEAIGILCKQHGLYLIEDSAHAIGTTYHGRAIGGIADLTCFSFHPVKTVTAGEGGAITTNDARLYQKLMLYRGHGITHDRDMMEHEPHGSWYYEQLELGYNYRMTDFQAALLRSQLQKLGIFSKRRKEIAAIYQREFSAMEELVLQHNNPFSDTTPHLYLIQLKLELLNCNRQEFFAALRAENIYGQIHYIPVYHHPYYQRLGYSKGLCPVAEQVYERIITLPIFYRMTDEDVLSVVAAVKKIVAWYRRGGEEEKE